MMFKRYHFVLIIGLTLSVSTSLSSQANITSNQQILSRLLVTPVLNIFADTLELSNSMKIQGNNDGLLNLWLIQNLTDSCLSKNYLVYSSPDSGFVPNYAIRITNPRVEINYRSAGGKLLVFQKGVKRKIKGSYHLQIQKRGGQVLFSREISGQYQDTIPNNMIDQVENEKLPFTIGTEYESPFVNRWLEPVLVTATTMTVIYLFYTLRSEQ
ncbi:MAG: hypothetical protein GWN01_12240 [Nitrosopumilaceae archaeon]|nr:hypothetical protein [Nitrosopumilaceae archaeon]NIX62247.1 hypothetical protein [Nitrosopumilaceae archaeon]